MLAHQLLQQLVPLQLLLLLESRQLLLLLESLQLPLQQLLPQRLEPQLELKGFRHRNQQRHRAFRESLLPYRGDHGGSKAWRDEHRPSGRVQSFR